MLLVPHWQFMGSKIESFFRDSLTLILGALWVAVAKQNVAHKGIRSDIRSCKGVSGCSALKKRN